MEESEMESSKFDERATQEARDFFKHCAAKGVHEQVTRWLPQILLHFPTNEQEDARFPVEELKALLETVEEALNRNEMRMETFAYDASALDKGATIFFNYYRRNGPGTPYLAAFSIFVRFARQRLREAGRPVLTGQWALTTPSVVGLKSISVLAIENVTATTEVLNRVPILPSEDAVSMLKLLKRLFSLVRCDPKYSSTSDENQRSKLLHQILHLGEPSIVLEQTQLCIELLCLANEVCGGKEVAYDSLTMDDSSWVMRNLFLDALVKLNASRETQLLLIQALFQQDVGLTQNVLRLVPIGLDLVKQLPNTANGFLGALSNCLHVKHMMTVLTITSMPEVLQLVEDTASTTNINAVKFLFRYFILVCKRSSNVLSELLKDTQPILERFSLPLKLTDAQLQGVEQRLAQKLVELFSQPSFLVNEKLDDFGVSREYPLIGIDGSVYVKWNVSLEYPVGLSETFVKFKYRIADQRFKWVHKMLVNSILLFFVDGRPELIEAEKNTAIWLSDRSRCICDENDEEEMKAMNTIISGMSYDLVLRMRMHNLDLLLLLTWLRAPSMLPRLRTRSKLRLLSGDIIRRLSEMVGEFRFHYRASPT